MYMSSFVSFPFSGIGYVVQCPRFVFSFLRIHFFLLSHNTAILCLHRLFYVALHVLTTLNLLSLHLCKREEQE